MTQSSSPPLVTWGVGLTLIAAILVGAIGRWVFLNPAGMPTEKIVLGAETVPHASPIWIAEHNGYFPDQGIEVQIREYLHLDALAAVKPEAMTVAGAKR